MNTTVLLKAIYKLNASPIKLSMAVSQNQDKKIYNCMETQKTPKLQSNVVKEMELEESGSLS